MLEVREYQVDPFVLCLFLFLLIRIVDIIIQQIGKIVKSTKYPSCPSKSLTGKIVTKSGPIRKNVLIKPRIGPVTKA